MNHQRIIPICMRLAFATLVLSLGGCVAERLARDGRTAIQQGRYEEGLGKLKAATQSDPRDFSYKGDLQRQSERVLLDILGAADANLAAGEINAAEHGYRRALGLDPGSVRAQGGIDAAARARRLLDMVTQALEADAKGQVERALDMLHVVMSEDPGHREAKSAREAIEARRFRQVIAAPLLKSRLTRPITLEFREAGLRTVFDALSKASSINFIFDKDVRPDLRISISVKDVLIEQAVDLILEPNQLASKVLNDNTLLIFPNNPAKVKEYQSLVIRSFYLENADVKQTQNLIKTMLKTKDIYIDEKLNLLVIRDTPDVIRLAEQLIAVQDHAEPEVLLEIEVLEVLRSRLFELGVRFPDSLNVNRLGYVTGTGSATINLKNEVGASNLLSNPRIRVKNREKARVLIGNRIPVISSVVTPAATTPVVTENIQYLDVGLKLEAEPSIAISGNVAIKLNLEVSTLGDAVTTKNGTVAYRVGTRTAATVLQIRDGETQTLMGLIQDDDIERAQRLPGLGDIPLVGKLFSNTRGDGQKTEIILTITPRIVRNVPRPSLAESALWSGSESTFRVARPMLNLPEQASTKPAVPGAKPAVTPGAKPAVDPSAPAASGPMQLSWGAPAGVKPGEEFTVILQGTAGAPVGAAAFQLRFDPDKLSVLGVAEGGFLAQGGVQTTFRQDLDAKAGRISVTMSRTGEAGATGSGPLVAVRFKAGAASGLTRVDLASANPAAPNGSALMVNAAGPLELRVGDSGGAAK
jgi:general secretion pathway protein D